MAQKQSFIKGFGERVDTRSHLLLINAKNISLLKLKPNRPVNFIKVIMMQPAYT